MVEVRLGRRQMGNSAIRENLGKRVIRSGIGGCKLSRAGSGVRRCSNNHWKIQLGRHGSSLRNAIAMPSKPLVSSIASRSVLNSRDRDNADCNNPFPPGAVTITNILPANANNAAPIKTSGRANSNNHLAKLRQQGCAEAAE